MRHTAEQVPFALNLIAQLPGHGVEVAHQVGDFIAPLSYCGAYADVEIAARKLIGRVAQALNRFAEVVRNHQTHESRDDGSQLQHPENVAGHAL